MANLVAQNGDLPPLPRRVVLQGFTLGRVGISLLPLLAHPPLTDATVTTPTSEGAVFNPPPTGSLPQTAGV